MPTIKSNGIHLYFEAEGVGEPLLLIAGFACDHSIWSLVQPFLSSKYQIISFDNRGVGQSSAPDSPYSIQQMADDAAALLHEIGIGQVHVAGHSMGGQVAQELALTHPEMVRSLLLLSSCAKFDRRGKSLIETFGELPRLVDPQTTARLIMPWLYTDAFFSKPGAVEQLLKLLLEYPFPPTPQGMYQQSRAITACDTASRLGSIRCPTLILVGKEDILVPVQFSRQLAQCIPAAELVVLENTGHGLMIETPDKVAAAMLDFLARH